MTWAAAVAAAAVMSVAGAVFPGYQHFLYRSPAFRAAPASGAKLLALRVFAGAAAGLGALAAMRPDHYDAGPALLTVAFVAVLVALSSTDFDRRIIPNRLTYPAIALAAVFCWAWPDRDAGDVLVGGAFGLGLAIGLVLLGVLVGAALGVKDVAFGVGDAKLIVLIGLLTGWPAVMTTLFFGVVLAGVVAFALLVRRGARTVFSYGPYLAAAGVWALLWFDRFD